ncbi:ATP-binding protein [Streptomyces sp. 8K308]|uniref:ATP-binding protein n=1 Tax=Streptomyces sp. 8K308 TaxID=2530388 RepID=UPI001FB78A97|nr:ATP-binding protein [Streptomyces sp. 8K308]
MVLLGITCLLLDARLTEPPQSISLADIAQAAEGEEAPPPPTDESPSQSEEQQWVLRGASVLLAEEQRQLRSEAIFLLVTQGAIALMLVAGAAAGFGWVLAGRVLAPLRRVTETARRIAGAPVAGHGLHERIALSGRSDEVKELADSFDTMVKRLDRSFEGQRRFVANASHELRTPLTLNRALVEMAMHRKTASADVRQLGENLLEINARQERLIAGLLLLARAEHEISDRSPVDLADVVSHVVAQTAAEASAAGVTVRETTAQAVTSGDVALLEGLIHNLVQNAIRHNTGDGSGWVSVASRTTASGRVEVEVINSGPTVPPYDIPKLFEPFRRLSADRVSTTKSAGLGLSIARSVAHVHAGTLTAAPRLGGGLIMTVVLPGS